MEVKEVKCKTIMSKSGLHDSDFSINPYRGCQNNCVYCYAPFVIREKRPWGIFLEVKTNAADVLSKEILKNKKRKHSDKQRHRSLPTYRGKIQDNKVNTREVKQGFLRFYTNQIIPGFKRLGSFQET